MLFCFVTKCYKISCLPIVHLKNWWHRTLHFHVEKHACTKIRKYKNDIKNEITKLKFSLHAQAERVISNPKWMKSSLMKITVMFTFTMNDGEDPQTADCAKLQKELHMTTLLIWIQLKSLKWLSKLQVVTMIRHTSLTTGEEIEKW